MRPSRPTHSGFINGQNVIRLVLKVKLYILSQNIFSEMRPTKPVPTNTNFISGENVIRND